MVNFSATSIREFYQELFGDNCPDAEHFIGEMSKKDIGHFNVFDIEKMYAKCRGKLDMPYNRRTYYKISLINGNNRVEFADKVVEIRGYAILFGTPKIPYRYTPLDLNQRGHFCVFTKEFMSRSKTAVTLDELPIFQPHTDFIFELSEEQAKGIEAIFFKMHNEIQSDYAFKYDLIRNYLMELIHTGQKLKPIAASTVDHNASTRITTLFLELLERQFPIASISQSLQLKTAKDYADTLNIHVNHLNKVLKDATGRTTTAIIASRVAEEARILLRQSDWSISEIAFCLGFEEVAHFSNFFKKQAGLSPLQFKK